LAKGWRVHRPSWPDFLIENEQGCFAVEVKGRGDRCSLAQMKTFDALERAGLPVYLWREIKPDTLERWKRSRPIARQTGHPKQRASRKPRPR
jgi:hypothetical protein